jgi:hypothetical protein
MADFDHDIAHIFYLLLQAQVQKMKKENVKKKMRKGIEGQHEYH